jgi:hypothetical protein
VRFEIPTLYEAATANTIVDGLLSRDFRRCVGKAASKKGFMANKGNCKAKDCAREAVGKGYCRQHFRLWKAGEMPKARYKTCTFEKCRKHRHGTSSLCDEHFKAKHGKAAEAATAPAAAAEAAPAEAPAS